MKAAVIAAGVSLLWGASAVGATDEAAVPAAEQTKQAQPKFDVMEYRVIGNTALSVRDIERVLYPLLGAAKTFADVEAARKALENFYHAQGYGTVFVDLPPQTIREGVVRLRVTEGRIESTLIGGARYFAERDVIAQLPAATPGTVLQLSKLQSELTAVNTQTPDRSVVPILKAGSAPGTVDLSLQVNDTLPLHGSVELNNQATLDTRELRTVLNLSYNEMFGRLDSLALQYQFTPQQVDQVRVWGANYALQAFESGLQPSLSYVNSNSNVPTPGALGVLGIGEITSAKLGYPLLSSQASLQSVSVEADYKHFRNLINQNATTALDTPITYLNLSAVYSGLWRSDIDVTTFAAAVNAGPRHLVGNQSAFENDRYKGRANYFDLRADLATTLKLPAGLSLRLRAAGQGAADPLITNEDYSIAGIDGVRGYLESEELVDKGAKGTIQLISPGMRWHDFVLGDAYSFFDAAKGSVIDALPEQPASFRLRSWGFGLDLLPGKKITGSATWAKALDDAAVTHSGESRVLFDLRGSF
jgi:hemolysin activation/secretion protein